MNKNEVLFCSNCGLLMQGGRAAYQINCPRCEKIALRNSSSIEYRLGLRSHL